MIVSLDYDLCNLLYEFESNDVFLKIRYFFGSVACIDLFNVNYCKAYFRDVHVA